MPPRESTLERSTGQRVIVRPVTKVEFDHMLTEVEKYGHKVAEEDRIYFPARWVIALADDPSVVLKSFGSRIGGWNREYALREVAARARRGLVTYDEQPSFLRERCLRLSVALDAGIGQDGYWLAPPWRES